MSDKRHLVLYGISTVVLVVLAAVIALGGFSGKSDRPEAPSVATSTETTIATTTSIAERPAPAPAPKPFQYEIASTVASRTQGLSGRSNIKSDYGMLFVFPDKDRHGFWMKDMLVPIDIIWISDAKTVIGIEADVSPSTYPNVFYPPEPVRYVLETKAGEAARLGLATGTKINLPLPYGE